MKLASLLSSSLVLVLAACGGHGSSGFGDGGGGDGGTGFGDSGFGFGDSSLGDGSAGGCNPNPGNFDIPGNNCDDDGDGTVDNPQGACDQGLPAASPTAQQFAKAIGLCPNQGASWGVVSATYTQGYQNNSPPDAQQYGTAATFGTGGLKARQGSVLGILSSGVAAAQDCGAGQFKGNTCTMTGPGSPPPGYPYNGVCPGASDANDVVNLVLKVKVPNNAKGFSFDFNFLSGEWPEWVCTSFNDSFVAWLTSSAWQGKGGDFNISLDGNNNPVSVNNNFFQVCSPANATVGCLGTPSTASCSLGASQLQGTGFLVPGDMACGQNDSGGGATGWLTTQAPVTPGETITIQFMVWNTGDEAYDSSVLLDNWQWVASDTTVGTTRPPN